MSPSFDYQSELEQGHKAMLSPDILSTGTGSHVTIPQEVFERMCRPKVDFAEKKPSVFGGPTAIAVAGFLLCTTPLSMQLLGWHGADKLGYATVGSYFWIGGLLLTLSGIGEWVRGETYLSTLFTTFGAFWFTFGATLLPSYNAFGAYGAAADGNGIAKTWSSMREFHNTFAFFLVAMTMVSTVFFIASLRVCVTFVLILGMLVPCLACLSASYFAYGSGNQTSGDRLQYAGAGLLLALSLVGWYEFTSLVLESVDFPYALPLGDLSSIVKGRAEKQRAKASKED